MTVRPVEGEQEPAEEAPPATSARNYGNAVQRARNRTLFFPPAHIVFYQENENNLKSCSAI